MVIYGEYLFIENFVAGIFLIIMTARLTGQKPAAIRIIMGAFLCGISGFIIFLPASGVLSSILRVAACFACVASVFGIKDIVKTAGLFLILTFASAGGVMMLLLWRKTPVISHQGIIYMDALTYLRLLCFGILIFGFVYWFVKLIRRYGRDIAIKGKVCFIIDGKSYFFRAFVDSGNCLKEPLTGKPVILLDRKGASRLPFKAENMPSRYRLIPYRSVGVKSGSLEAVRTDRIIFGEHIFDGGYIAFYEGDFDDFEVLMSREFLEGGVLHNV